MCVNRTQRRKDISNDLREAIAVAQRSRKGWIQVSNNLKSIILQRRCEEVRRVVFTILLFSQRHIKDTLAIGMVTWWLPTQTEWLVLGLFFVTQSSFY